MGREFQGLGCQPSGSRALRVYIYIHIYICIYIYIFIYFIFLGGGGGEGGGLAFLGFRVEGFGRIFV